MYTFLIVLLVIDSLILVGAVLVQAGKGGGLAASFGGAASSAEAFVGLRQAANLFTKMSWWSAGIFLALAFILQIMTARGRPQSSILDRPFSQQPAPRSTPTTEGAAPAVPLTPARPPTEAPAKEAPSAGAPAKTAPTKTAPTKTAPTKTP